MNCLSGIYCKSSWHYFSVVDFLWGDTRILWRGCTVSQVGIIFLSLISYGVIREFFGGDVL